MNFESVVLFLALAATFFSLLGACIKIERLQEEVRNWEQRYSDFVLETAQAKEKAARERSQWEAAWNDVLRDIQKRGSR